MTRYEKVISMSLEEMAKAMPCPYEHIENDNGCFNSMECIEPISCFECCKRYLESEYKESEQK